jgi:adenylyltransferase/sulfurtransferase
LTNNKLNPAELKRYSRHILVPEIGYEGQVKLKNTSVLVVGAGGLGCPALQYLVAAGIGTIGIMDGDTIEESNLQRQILYSTNDIGKYKVQTAAEKLTALNPYVKIVPYITNLTTENAATILPDYAIIIDGTDNAETRYLIDDVCSQLNKPFVYGAIERFNGQVSVFNYDTGSSYRSLFPEPQQHTAVCNCSTLGVLNVMTGIIGSLQALEAIKIATGIGDVLSNKLLLIDGRTMHFNILSIEKEAAEDNDTHLAPRTNQSTHTDETIIRSVSVADFEQLLKNKEAVFILDIRESEEYKQLHIPDSHNIPFLDIDERVDEILQQKQIVLVCNYGIKSKQLIPYLQEMYHYDNVCYLENGITEWLKYK